jgi:NADH-quinone oxidoreductase subunit I
MHLLWLLRGESCPLDAIVMTRIYEFHFEQRGQAIIDKDHLLAIGDRKEAEIAADRAADAPYP